MLEMQNLQVDDEWVVDLTQNTFFKLYVLDLL